MKLLDRICRHHSISRRLEESRPRLYRVAWSWCHDAALADDLTQETLAKALVKAGQLRNPAALDTWLFRILNNCWRDHFRRSRDTTDIDEVPCANEETPEDEHDRGQVVGRVREAISGLPAGQRRVLTLIDLEGFSYQEVAEALDIPIGTVMSRLCRARRALRQRLLAESGAGPDQAGYGRIRRIK